MKKVTIAILFIFLCSTRAFAIHPLITDDADTLGQGNAQLEVNDEYDHDEEAGVSAKVYELASTLTNGLIERADLAVELKWKFYNRSNLGRTLMPGFTLPTGDEDKGLGTGKAGYGAFLIGSLDLAPFMAHANLGYLRNENETGDRKDIWHASLASEYAVNEKLTTVANIGLETNPDRLSDTPPAFLLGGLIYSITDKISLDGGLKFGLNKPEVDYAILAGMTLSF